MFYITSIIDENNEKKSYGVCASIDISTNKLHVSSNHLRFFKFGVYDDTDGSLEIVDIYQLIKCFLLKIKIKGITPKYKKTYFKNTYSLYINVVTVPYDNFFQLSNVVHLNSSKFNFNPNLFDESVNPENIEFLIIKDSIKAPQNHFYKCMFYLEDGILKKTQSTIGIAKCVKKNVCTGKVYEMDDTVLLSSEIKGDFSINLINTSFDCYNYVLYLKSIMDLYMLTLSNPQSTIHSHIVDDYTFIVDTIFTRFIFKTSPKLSSYILKSKLLNKPIR